MMMCSIAGVGAAWCDNGMGPVWLVQGQHGVMMTWSVWGQHGGDTVGQWHRPSMAGVGHGGVVMWPMWGQHSEFTVRQ